MNTKSLRQIICINLGFWSVAIFGPIVIRLIPTATGQPPKFYEFGIPLFQCMLALGTTHLIRSVVLARKDA
jgi:hypothetical protein